MDKEIKMKLEAYSDAYKTMKKGEKPGVIENSFAESRKVKLYLTRSQDDFLLAQAVKKLIENSELKSQLDLPEDYLNLYHWLIIISYYSMYHAATAAIAKKKIKCKSHEATIVSLAKHYGTEEELEFDFIEKLNYVYIEFIESGREGRQGAQYDVEKEYSQQEAYQIFEYASKFVERLAGMLEES